MREKVRNTEKENTIVSKNIDKKELFQKLKTEKGMQRKSNSCLKLEREESFNRIKISYL